MEKRRKASPNLPLVHLAIVAVVFTSILFLWKYRGCPGPPLEISFTSTAPLLLLPHNALHFPPPYARHTLNKDDRRRLVDLTDFKFLINHDCNQTDRLLVVVVVHSAPVNFQKRNVIRKTWGSKLNLFFMLGKTLDKQLEQAILVEDGVHHDLIVGNFIDSYRNMTYKHVMALKWMTYYCTEARYTLKTDDDVFVNPSALMQFLEHTLSPLGARQLMYCQTTSNAAVKRTFRSKWRVSYSEYQQRVFPPYCLGWAVLYSPDVVFSLYRESQRAKYFWIDDVFVTGLMAMRARLPHSDLGSLVLNDETYGKLVSKSLNVSFIFGPPNMSSDKILELWKIVNDQNGGEAF